MRAVLFLCLLAFMTCEKDIIDIGKCLYKDPKVKEIIADVMVAIVTKDFDKLLTQIKEALPDLIKALAGCVLDTKVVEDTPKLNACSEMDKIRCNYQCSGLYQRDKNFYQNCVNVCLNPCRGSYIQRRHK